MKEETTVLETLMPLLIPFAWFIFALIAGALAGLDEAREKEREKNEKDYG